jgi:hypothetical protein
MRVGAGHARDCGPQGRFVTLIEDGTQRALRARIAGMARSYKRAWATPT